MVPTPSSVENVRGAASRPEPEISIVICTHNRCAMLDDALGSLFAMRMPRDAAIEVLVVDNASDDGTRDVTRRYAAIHGEMLAYIFEPVLGLSIARNRALRHARGRIIAFADDDVLFDREWLAAALDAFANAPGVDCVGGRTRLAFESGAPSWLTPYLASVYGVGIDDSGPRSMRFPEHPYGLNMAFRRSVFERVGEFSAELGRLGGKLLSGEETELFARVDRAGLGTFYVPDMVVHHRVPQARTRVSWVVRRHFWGGVSRATADALSRDLTSDACARHAYYEVRNLLSSLLRRSGTSGRGGAIAPGSPMERLARGAQQLGAAWRYAGMAWSRARRWPEAARS